MTAAEHKAILARIEHIELILAGNYIGDGTYTERQIVKLTDELNGLKKRLAVPS
jgi:hypothetical protein